MTLTRSTPLIFLFVVITLSLLIPQSSATNLTATTTYYVVSGQLCYNNLGFTESRAVSGELRVELQPLNNVLINYDLSGTIVEVETGVEVESHTESGTWLNRVDADGNYSLFLSTIPAPETQQIYNFLHSVEGIYQGARYVSVNGLYVKTHYYVHSVTELQNVLRFEWYFEWETGVLLRFVKSIEINFFRVQWLDYYVKNTTLSLTSTDPVTAVLSNIQENFYAIFGSICVVVAMFYYLIQKKTQREVPN